MNGRERQNRKCFSVIRLVSMGPGDDVGSFESTRDEYQVVSKVRSRFC